MIITQQMIILVLAILYQIINKLFQGARTNTPVDITKEIESINELRLKPADQIEAEADAISKIQE